MDNIGGVWRTVGGRRIFIKDGQDLASAMKESGKFSNKQIEDKKDKTPSILNNRKNLVEYVKQQIDIDLEKVATENQFAPRRGLNIDSSKMTINELNNVKDIMIKKDIRMESNGIKDYFIYYEKKK